jgi:hypothetical protein
MVRLTFALLPSPLLGPETWGPVAEVLRSGGWSVLEQPGAAEPPAAPGGVLKRFLAALPTDRDLVLVPTATPDSTFQNSPESGASSAMSSSTRSCRRTAEPYQLHHSTL